MEVWNSCFVLQLRRSDKRLKTAGLLCLYVWLRAKTALLMSIARETWQLSQAVCSSWQKNDACFGKTERWGWGDIQHWTLSTLPPPKKKTVWQNESKKVYLTTLRILGMHPRGVKTTWFWGSGRGQDWRVWCSHSPWRARNFQMRPKWSSSSDFIPTSLDLKKLGYKTWSAAYSSAGKTAMVLLMEEILHHLGCIKPYK